MDFTDEIVAAYKSRIPKGDIMSEYSEMRKVTFFDYFILPIPQKWEKLNPTDIEIRYGFPLGMIRLLKLDERPKDVCIEDVKKLSWELYQAQYGLEITKTKEDVLTIGGFNIYYEERNGIFYSFFQYLFYEGGVYFSIVFSLQSTDSSQINKYKPLFHEIISKLELINTISDNKIDSDFNEVYEIFLKNPYRMLQLPCNATKQEIDLAYEKLVSSFNNGNMSLEINNFGLKQIEMNREYLDNLLALTKTLESKLFWFCNTSLQQRYEDANTLILGKSIKDITYDIFLINYLSALILDPYFTDENKWRPVLRYIFNLFKYSSQEIILTFQDRFTTEKLSDSSFLQDLITEIKSKLLLPIEKIIETASIKTLANFTMISEKDLILGLSLINHPIFDKVIQRIKDDTTILFEKAIEKLDKYDRRNSTDSEKKEIVLLAEKLLSYEFSHIEPISGNQILNKHFGAISRSNYTKVLKRIALELAVMSERDTAFLCGESALRIAPPELKPSVISLNQIIDYILKGHEQIIEMKAEGRVPTDISEELLNHQDLSMQILVLMAHGRDPASQYTLSILCDPDTPQQGVTKDWLESARWMHWAADQNYKDASVRFGTKALVEAFKSRSENIRKEAIDVLQRAADNGDREAIQVLDSLPRAAFKKIRW